MKDKFPKFFIIITLVILCYIFYRSEIVHNGELRDSEYLRYYIFCIFSFFIFLFYFFLSETLKLYFRIFFFSLITSFYVFEIFLNYFELDDLKKKIIYKYKFGKKYDTRSVVEVYQDLKKTNNDSVIVEAIFPTNSFYKNLKDVNMNFELQSLSGHSNIITIYCNDKGEYSTYMSDRYGFNNPDYEWDKENIDFLLVGDSFVHGACVNRPYDIASQMRENGKRSVLNLGYINNSTLAEYATLREYLKPGVKNILFFYYENDLFSLNNETSFAVLNEYLKNKSFSQNLIKNQKQIDKKTESKINLRVRKYYQAQKINFNHIFKLKKTRQKIFKDKLSYISIYDTYINNQTWETFEKILEEVKKMSVKKNSNLYFVYLPLIINKDVNLKNLNQNYKEIKKILKKLDINLIDYKMYFENFNNRSSLSNPLIKNEILHLNEKGYQNLKEYILYKINEFQN